MIKIQSQQILVPKSVYIGDKAELQCSFNYSSPVLTTLVQNGVAELSLEHFTEELNYKDYEIKSVQLSQIGIDFYQLTVVFVPWKTGEIQFPTFAFKDFLVDFEPVSIVSLTEQNSITSMQELTSLLLLPGTTYRLYGLLIFSIIAVILLIRGIIKRKEVMFFIKNLQLKIKYKKNVSVTRKKLLALTTSNAGSKEIASEIQQIMRNYLEVRFSYPFTKTVTSDFMKGFYAVTAGLLSDKKEEAFENFVSCFIRTDFIRYSSQSDFLEGEVKSLVEILLKNIAVIETVDSESKGEDGSAGGKNV